MTYCNYDEFEKLIGYFFKSRDYLVTALTHSSYANEYRISDNERLEFLGDAVLELVSSDYIYNTYKNMPEGKMTRLRASIVCEPTLAMCAREIKIDNFLKLGKGEEKTGGRFRDSLLSDALEAVIGAIYLDGGLECAGEFIFKFILNDIENKQLFFDSKTYLQEFVREKFDTCPEYRIINESGPDHCKTYSVIVIVKDKVLGQGTGPTKKNAEQHAAYNALLKLKQKEK